MEEARITSLVDFPRCLKEMEMTAVFLITIIIILGFSAVMHLHLVITTKEYPRIEEQTEHTQGKDVFGMILTTALLMGAIISLTEQSGCG